MRFRQRRRRRDRIPGHHGHAGEHAAQGRGGVAVDDDLARRLVHALDEIRIALGQIGGGVIVSGLDRGQVQVGRFHLLRKLLADGLLDFGHVDFEQLGHDAHVNHVLDQLAQLGLGADGRDQFVVGNGVENQVGAQAVELQRLVVQHGCAGGQRHHVFLRGLGIHRDHEIDFFLARDVAVFVGANGVPGGQTGDVRGKQVLAGDRNSHLKNAAQQNGVGTLRAGAVDGRDLNTHVVDDRLWLWLAALSVERYIRGGHSLPFLVPGAECLRSLLLMQQNPLLYGSERRKRADVPA